MIYCSVYLKSLNEFITDSNSDFDSVRGDILIKNDGQNIILINIPLLSILSDFLYQIEKSTETYVRDFIVSDHDIFTLEINTIDQDLFILHTETQVELQINLYDFKIFLLRESINFYHNYFLETEKKVLIRDFIFKLNK